MLAAILPSLHRAALLLMLCAGYSVDLCRDDLLCTRWDIGRGSLLNSSLLSACPSCFLVSLDVCRERRLIVLLMDGYSHAYGLLLCSSRILHPRRAHRDGSTCSRVYACGSLLTTGAPPQLSTRLPLKPLPRARYDLLMLPKAYLRDPLPQRIPCSPRLLRACSPPDLLQASPASLEILKPVLLAHPLRNATSTAPCTAACYHVHAATSSNPRGCCLQDIGGE